MVVVLVQAGLSICKMQSKRMWNGAIEPLVKLFMNDDMERTTRSEGVFPQIFNNGHRRRNSTASPQGNYPNR